MSNRRAFTLVEMTIVIGIIILLAGLTLAVSVSVVLGSEIRQTELTVQLLDSAIQEWQTQADRSVSFGKPDEPVDGAIYDILQPDDPLDPADAVLVTKKLFAIIMRPESIRQILAQIDPEFTEHNEFDHDDDTATDDVETMIVSDAWGNPYIAVLPGRVWVAGVDDESNLDYFRDDDGSIQTEIEKICGVAVNRQLCFVSAGPDGKFGERNALPDSIEFEQTRDNLYSYTPTAPAP